MGEPDDLRRSITFSLDEFQCENSKESVGKSQAWTGLSHIPDSIILDFPIFNLQWAPGSSDLGAPTY